MELEAMKKDIKSEVAEEGQDEVWSEARTIPIKKMSPLKTDFETPQMGLSARSTARPTYVESAVLGLMSGTMETKDIDSLDEVVVRSEAEIKRYEIMLLKVWLA